MIPIPPPGYGAVEKHIWNLAAALRARGHAVEIVNEPLGPGPWNEYRFALRARRRLRHPKPQVLHLHTTGVAYAFHTLGPRDYVYTSHSRHWTLRRGPGERLGFALERRAVAGARRVIALSPRMASLMAPQVHADVVPNGVDVDRYRPRFEARRGDRVLAVGRVEPHKGFHLAAQALQGTHAHLFIVGPTPDRGYAEALGATPGVTLVGTVDEETLVDHMATADVFVHPSASEAFSLAVVEAMASGLPVVGTEVCEGQVEDGSNGFIVRGDRAAVVGGIREGIARLLADGDLRRHMGERSRALAVERYRWSEVAQGVEAVYRRALEVDEG